MRERPYMTVQWMRLETRDLSTTSPTFYRNAVERHLLHDDDDDDDGELSCRSRIAPVKMVITQNCMVNLGDRGRPRPL